MSVECVEARILADQMTRCIVGKRIGQHHLRDTEPPQSAARQPVAVPATATMASTPSTPTYHQRDR